MIYSDNCWMKDRCYKYKNDDTAECRSGDIFCPKLFKINELYENALLSESQKERVKLHLDADGCDELAFDSLAQFELDVVKNVQEGRNLFIYSSNVGNGKTSWSVRILETYLEKIWAGSDITCRGMFINVPRFFLALKDSISNNNDYVNHIKKYVLTADLVVWDEIGTKSLTSFEFENLLSLIDARITNHKSNIYTSNVSGLDLQDCIGDRLYSRIVNLSDNIELKGKDKRGKRFI